MLTLSPTSFLSAAPSTTAPITSSSFTRLPIKPSSVADPGRHGPIPLFGLDATLPTPTITDLEPGHRRKAFVLYLDVALSQVEVQLRYRDIRMPQNQFEGDDIATQPQPLQPRQVPEAVRVPIAVG